MCGDPANVLVLRDRPERPVAVGLAPVHGVLETQTRPGSVRMTRHVAIGRHEIKEIDIGCHKAPTRDSRLDDELYSPRRLVARTSIRPCDYLKCDAASLD